MKKGKIYFCGVGGVSMSKLALFCQKNGVFVYGSDNSSNENVEILKSFGVKVFCPQTENNLMEKPDLFIYSSAIKSDNPEFVAAKNAGVEMLSRAEFLNAVSYNFKTRIGVAGCHGKTTTGFMISNVLSYIGEKIFVHVGGQDVNLGAFTYSGNDYIVSEVCEYNKNIEKITSDIAVVLNTDLDHAECYKNEAELLEYYSAYLNRAQYPVIRYEEGEKLELNGKAITFSVENCNADYFAFDISFNKDDIFFRVKEKGNDLGDFVIKSICAHNVVNALAAISVCRIIGIGHQEIKDGLCAFSGVNRRMEIIGKRGDTLFICDYAHHPDEIEKTIEDIERVYSKNVITVFQPHTFSRTKTFFNKYVSVLGQREKVLIYRTYPARENPSEGLSGFDLSLALGCGYFEEDKKLSDEITRLNKKCVVFFGAGDIYDIAKRILKFD